MADERSRGNVLLSRARVFSRLARWQEAADAAAAALEVFDRLAIQPTAIRALLVRSQALSALGNFEAAAELAEEAIRRHDRWRTAFVTDSQRVGEDESEIATAYDLLVPLRALQGRPLEALTRAEEARSRTLLDLLASRQGDRSALPAGPPAVEVDPLGVALAALEAQWRQTSDPALRQELEAQRRDLRRRQRWNDFQRALASPLVASEPLAGAALLDIARQAESTLLIYYVNATQITGFLLQPEGEPMVRVLHLALGHLTEQVEAFRRALANDLFRDRADALGSALWDQLVAPFAESLPAGGRLILVPHGPLHRLPFEALRDPAGRLLLERWTTSVSPSVTALEVLRRQHRPPAADDRLLAFWASPKAGLRAPDLDALSALFARAEVVPPEAASFERYAELGPDARHILFATVGVLTPNDRSETYLEIPASATHESRLSSAEIAARPLAAELITLVACDAAAAEALFSDEKLDLTRSFLIAGSAAVLGTRWRIPEEASLRFAQDFFTAYRTVRPDGRRLRKDEALAEVRRQAAARGESPWLWAAWVLVGDAR